MRVTVIAVIGGTVLAILRSCSFLKLVSGVNLANYDGDRNPNQPIQAEENIILKAGSKCGESD